MAIKVDLTTAFDMIEWKLLLNILSILGFSNTFSGWIEECISTSRLSFLINGAAYGNMQPTRGIRHGDPLSPFIFVTYIELLSRLLTFEENNGNFKGIKISRTSHSISHLLFAYDLVIFCRANTQDATCIRNTLNKFSLWSSQKANTSKSLVHFSNNTPPQLKVDILSILDFKECDHVAKHPGFPFCHLSSRKEAFQEVTNKISSCLSGWKSKTLSQASRTILLKAVPQAIPTYVMSIDLLPLSTCTLIYSMMRKF
ncbi:PREDICTED: uncharacterized protein LOC105950125 [Erythranthe guttata]|uniref:uncharacterized protein LOC105950125 n=1 Tax=Erythranthe guttata TaxID=4155 RepID=UPI00064DB3A6|nr:PREDICTED: uncharacterized protein LOC105950125 [Erythranthe guttata]|eukprot:XP_012828896.1 PREDICTED: uncharacterized protein LOC105950125 [Erythranthe guttata]